MASTPNKTADATNGETVTQFVARAGNSVFHSSWLEVSQERIDTFAEVTEDRQYIHVDPVRAAAGPFGVTIAHGFLTLSLLSRFATEALPTLADQSVSVNYGFDRVRWVSPVPSGSRIRGVFTLNRGDWRSEDSVMLHYDAAVEIKGRDKPALVAEWLLLLQVSGER